MLCICDHSASTNLLCLFICILSDSVCLPLSADNNRPRPPCPQPCHPKQEVSRCHASLLPAATSGAEHADPAVRDAAVALMAALAAKAGTAAVLDKGLAALDEGRRRALEERLRAAGVGAGSGGNDGAGTRTAVAAASTAAVPRAMPTVRVSARAMPAR